MLLGNNSHVKWSRREYLLVGCLAVGIAGCAEDVEDADDADGVEAQAQPEQTDTEGGGGDVAAVVGELVAGTGMEMVVRDVETTEALDEFQQAASGNVYHVVRMAIKNTTEEFSNFSAHLQASVIDEAGTAYEAEFAVTDTPLDSGLLAPGEVARGDAVFETPEDAEGLTLAVDLSDFDLFEYDRVEVDLAESADDVQDVEQSLSVDVSDPGDAVEHEGVTVSVVDVRWEDDLGIGGFDEETTSDGEFEDFDDVDDEEDFAWVAQENESGFVVPEIEVTNDRAEDLQVSTLLQMQVKTDDGLAYSTSLESSALDESFSEQQPIAPGETRRGELAYEVADEGELYWTYNFLDLAEPMKAFWRLD